MIFDKMDIDIQDRKSELEGLSIFVNHISQKLENIIKSLGWSEEHLLNKPDNLKVCQINKGHRVPKETYEDHIEQCILRSEGYHDQTPFPESSLSTSTIVIGKELQERIISEAAAKNPSFVTGPARNNRNIPRSSNRLIADFTPDERLALYDYTVSKTKTHHEGFDNINVTLPQNTESKTRHKSIFEILAEERNAKRRRTKYKSVHTNRKSQTEILREVIENQMEMLCDYIKLENQTVNAPTTKIEEIPEVKTESPKSEPKIKSDIKRELRKSSDRETVRSYDSDKYSKRSDGSVTSRRSREAPPIKPKIASTVKSISKYEEKLNKHEEKLTKFEEKIIEYDEKISKCDEKVSKYDEKLRRYEEETRKRKTGHKEFRERSPVRDFIDAKRAVYGDHYEYEHYDRTKIKDFEKKPNYKKYREKQWEDDEYRRRRHRSRSRERERYYHRR